jgi:hypothetical protein
MKSILFLALFAILSVATFAKIQEIHLKPVAKSGEEQLARFEYLKNQILFNGYMKKFLNINAAEEPITNFMDA